MSSDYSKKVSTFHSDKIQEGKQVVAAREPQNLEYYLELQDSINIQAGCEKFESMIKQDQLKLIDIDYQNPLSNDQFFDLEFINQPQHPQISKKVNIEKKYISKKTIGKKEIKKLLKQVNLKNKKQKTVKNVNIPKFLCRIFFKYLSKYGNYFQRDINSFNRAKQLVDRANEWSKQSKNNYLSLKHLEEFFGPYAQKFGMDPYINRKIMNHIMRNLLHEEVTQNSQLKHKISYLNTLKIYGLRCSNPQLSMRVQSK